MTIPTVQESVRAALAAVPAAPVLPCRRCGGPAYGMPFGRLLIERCHGCRLMVPDCQCPPVSIAVRAAIAFGDWPPAGVAK